MAENSIIGPAKTDLVVNIQYQFEDQYQFDDGKVDEQQVAEIQNRQLFEEYVEDSSQNKRKEFLNTQKVNTSKALQTKFLRNQWEEMLKGVPSQALYSNLQDGNANLMDVPLSHRVASSSKSSYGQLRKLPAVILEKQQTIPFQKVYIYLQKNQLARDEGKIMYKLDNDGELLPVIDEQFRSTYKDPSQYGKSRMHKMQVVRSVLEQFGNTGSSQKAIRKALQMDGLQLAEMIQSIEKTDCKEQPLITQLKSVEATKEYLELNGESVCRRCYDTNCKLHGEPQVFPPPTHIGQFKLVKAETPCGPRCYLVKQQQQQQIQKQQQQQNGNSNSNEESSSMYFENGYNQEQQQQQQQLDFSKGQQKRKVFQNGIDEQQSKRVCYDGSKDSSYSSDQMDEVEQSSAKDDIDQWGVLEDESFQMAISSNEELTPCQISTIVLTKSCFEVNQRLLKLPPMQQQRLQDIPKRVGSGGSKRKKKSWPCQAQRELIKNQGGKLNQYKPCTCVGQCGSDCICVASGNFCEKFCACARDNCENKFGGCKCMSTCVSGLCPCQAADRECDPDLCQNCRTFVSNEDHKQTCKNMGLRKREHKHVIVGISDVQGWGAFINQNVKNGELIGEYTGDIISSFEADRRGKVYDVINLSYLFDLNKSQVVDAFDKGNKLRFANHSKKPNCKVRNMLVNGDHRLGIFAHKDLQKGDELLYDYKYTCETAPQWANEKNQAPEEYQQKKKPKIEKKQQKKKKNQKEEEWIWQRYDPADFENN